MEFDILIKNVIDELLDKAKKDQPEIIIKEELYLSDFKKNLLSELIDMKNDNNIETDEFVKCVRERKFLKYFMTNAYECCAIIDSVFEFNIKCILQLI